MQEEVEDGKEGRSSKRKGGCRVKVDGGGWREEVIEEETLGQE